jgi:hypothetical protein
MNPHDTPDMWDDLDRMITTLIDALDAVTTDVEKFGLYDPKHYDSPWWPESATKARNMLLRLEGIIRAEKGLDQ